MLDAGCRGTRFRYPATGGANLPLWLAAVALAALAAGTLLRRTAR